MATPENPKELITVRQYEPTEGSEYPGREVHNFRCLASTREAAAALILKAQTLDAFCRLGINPEVCKLAILGFLYQLGLLEQAGRIYHGFDTSRITTVESGPDCVLLDPNDCHPALPSQGKSKNGNPEIDPEGEIARRNNEWLQSPKGREALEKNEAFVAAQNRVSSQQHNLDDMLGSENTRKYD